MEIQGNQLIITIPDGMIIDEENSTFKCIKFKPITKKWISNPNKRIKGYEIEKGKILEFTDISPLCMEGRDNCKDIFATEKLAKSALAMAQISQIMVNDERFGGIVTDEEWLNETEKYALVRANGTYVTLELGSIATWYFLTFHTREQLNLFIEENKQLVKDYLMID